MEAIGLEIVNTFKSPNKPVRVAAEGSDKSQFLSAFSKMFSTVDLSEVQRSYMADPSWFKKNRFDLKIIHLDEDDEDSLSFLYKEYRKVLLKLYKLRKDLKEG